MHTAVVTGASSGIGRATAVALAEAGYWVLATGRDPARGQELVTDLSRTTGGGDYLPLDLTEERASARIVRRAIGHTGRIDVLVNNAGDHVLATTDEITDTDYDRVMSTNVRAPLLLTRAALPALRECGGVVVNVASEAGLVAVPGQVVYNMSKAALIMLTKSLAADHAADGVRAVSICPGTTRTPLVERAAATTSDPGEHERRLAAARPVGRLGEVGEIAAAIVYAASDSAGYLTGSEIVLDGGYTSI